MSKHFLTRIFYDAYKPSWDKTDIYTPKEVTEISERISKKIAKTQKRLQGKAPYSCDALQDILDYLGKEKEAVVNRTLFSSEMSDINDPNKMNAYAHILSCMNITFHVNKNEFWQKAITVVLGTLDPDVLLNTETWNLSSYIDEGQELQMIILVFQYCFERTKENIDNLPFNIFDDDYYEENDEEYDDEYDDDDEYDEDKDDEIAANLDPAVKKQVSQEVPSEHPDTQINYPKLTSIIRSAINQEAENIQEQLKGLTSAVQNEIEKKRKADRRQIRYHRKITDRSRKESFGNKTLIS